jgi:D-alanyl-D-alanine carboxypeptidase
MRSAAIHRGDIFDYPTKSVFTHRSFELNNAVAFNKAESGTAVLVDVNTGEVLAMANSPASPPLA